ncbi:hypothetical protein AAC387_Pa05g3040 [Persea americana]
MDASIGWGKDPMVWWHVYDLLSIGTPLAPEWPRRHRNRRLQRHRPHRRLHLASLGANLVLNYATSSAQADLLAAEISSSPSPSRAVAFQAKSLFDQAESAFSAQPHILVNCAGVLDPKYPTLAATAEEDWDNTFSVNVKGAFHCSKEAANRLVRCGGGRIICFTSSQVAALRPGYAAYTASNAAVEAMTKILAKELRGTQITANCVAPGPIATDMFFSGKTEEDVKRVVGICPLGRLGQTEDVAPLVGFLATDTAEWINGQVIRINGGYV